MKNKYIVVSSFGSNLKADAEHCLFDMVATLLINQNKKAFEDIMKKHGQGFHDVEQREN